MGIKEAIKNVRLGRWIEEGQIPPEDMASIVNEVKKPVQATDKAQDLAVVDAAELRTKVAESVKGGIATGVGLTICAAGLGRMLLAPSGIVGMGLAIGGGAVTVLFGGKTVKDYYQIHRKLKK